MAFKLKTKMKSEILSQLDRNGASFHLQNLSQLIVIWGHRENENLRRKIVTDSQLSAQCFIYVHHCIKSSQPPSEITNIPPLTKDHADIITSGQRMDLDIPSPSAE